MKKQLVTLIFSSVLVIGSLAYSPKSLADEPHDDLVVTKISKTVTPNSEEGYSDNEFVSSADFLTEPILDSAFDLEKNYQEGDLIAESASLTEAVASAISIKTTSTKASTSTKTKTPRGFYIYKDKTVSKYYSSIKIIPETLYTKQYNDGQAYKGNLNLKYVIASGKGYTATFSGTLSARVE